MSKPHLWKIGGGLGFRRKKIASRPPGRDTEENRQRRQAFVERMCTTDPKRMIFLDESGVPTQRTRRFGRASGWHRVHESTPEGNWKILTVLGAMSLNGMIATMTIVDATGAEVFLAFLDNFLRRELKPGDVVVMGNLSSRKVAGVRERLEAVGA